MASSRAAETTEKRTRIAVSRGHCDLYAGYLAKLEEAGATKLERPQVRLGGIRESRGEHRLGRPFGRVPFPLQQPLGQRYRGSGAGADCPARCRRQEAALPGLVGRVTCSAPEALAMTKPEEIDADLTLELDGSKITPAKFRQGVNAFVGLLESITQAVCREGPTVEWRMKVKAGSNLVGAQAAEGANPIHVERIQKLFADGFTQFEETGEVPPIYSDTAVRHVRNLAAISPSRPDDDTRIGVWVRRQRREITPRMNVAAKAALETGFDELGTIEGQLSVLSERGGPHFVIYEPLWDKPVQCVVPDELIESAKQYWRKRVAAHGTVHYRPDGVPTKIEADEIEVFPDDSDLPGLDEVEGILRIAG